MIYPLVKEMAAVGAPLRVPVAVACRILGFSTQGYYKWLKQPVSARETEEAELIAVLHQLHEDDPEGGYRVLADDIAELGYTLSERRVWRLCRIAGIQSVFTRRKTRYKTAGAPVHDDLVQRQFTAEVPNQLWLTDITEHRTREGKVYLCAIKDVFSNRIVGYSIDSRMKARIAVNALEMAVAHRGRPAGVIVHSDRGSQGGFNWSSQHLDLEVLDGSSSAGSGSGGAAEASVAWASEVPAARRGSVLGGDRQGVVAH
ncbi:ISMsm7, transposase orfB [Propionibacterium freudenreichii]|nr:ISMsm7, transposase orfB [Propionibacterium freudenreichii]